MIRIFNKGKDWDTKVNFVDSSNRLVGYDLDDDCCAHGGWFISPEIKDKYSYDDKLEKEPANLPDLGDYYFDEQFFQKVDLGDEFGAVVFRMIASEKPDLYLHLYNVHNGYYSKGFEASFGENRSGSV